MKYENREFDNRRKSFYLVTAMDSYYVVEKTGPMTLHDGFRAKPIIYLDGALGFDAGLDIHVQNIISEIGKITISDFQNNFKQYCTLNEFKEALEKFTEKFPEYFV